MSTAAPGKAGNRSMRVLKHPSTADRTYGRPHPAIAWSTSATGYTRASSPTLIASRAPNTAHSLLLMNCHFGAKSTLN